MESNNSLEILTKIFIKHFPNLKNQNELNSMGNIVAGTTLILDIAEYTLKQADPKIATQKAIAFLSELASTTDPNIQELIDNGVIGSSIAYYPEFLKLVQPFLPDILQASIKKGVELNASNNNQTNS